jgi:hypothetical protein
LKNIFFFFLRTFNPTYNAFDVVVNSAALGLATGVAQPELD